MNLGTLDIQLLADLAQLQSDMDKATSVVGRATEKMESLALGAARALSALGVGLSVGAVAAWASGVLDAAGAIHDLATQTGASVESLSRFQEIGRTSGTTADTIAGAMGRLAKNSALVDDEGKLAAIALNAMGVQFDAFRAMKPDEQLHTVAKALDGYEDGASKSAVAQALLGKEGAKLLPFLKDLAGDTETAAVLTAQQAAAADELGDKLTALRARVQGAAAGFLLDLLPAVDKFAQLVEPAIKVTAAWFTLFVAVPALASAAVLGFNAMAVAIYEGATAAGVLTASMTSTVAITKAAILQAGLLATAASLVVAAFAGWEIGSWLRENFMEAQLAGIAFVSGVLKGWEAIKFGAGVAWASISTLWGEALSGMGGALGGFLRLIAGGLSSLGLDAAADKMLSWAAGVTKATQNSTTLSSKLAVLEADYKRGTAAVSSITDAMADEAIAHFNSAKAADGNKKSSKDLADAIEAQRQKLKEEEEARKAATAAAEAARKKHEELLAGYLKTTEGIAAKVAATALEVEQDQKLTAAQKEFLPILDALRTGKANYTELERNGTIAKMEAALAADANNQAMAREAAWLKETADDNVKSAETRAKATETIREQIEKQRESNDTLLLSKEALAQNEIAKISERATSLERIATLMDEVDWTGKTSAEYRAQAAGLRELADLKEKGIHVQAAKDSAAEWKKTTDAIERGLTDSLFRAFESGKGFWKTLWDGIVATFQTTILKPIIQDVLSPFAQAWRQIANWISSTVLTPTINMITSGLGLGTFTGGAGAASGASGAAGTGLSLANLGGTLLGAGSALTSGIGAGFTLGAQGIGPALSMIGSASGLSSFAGGLGQLIGAAGPYALAAAAAVALLGNIFGSRGGPKVSGMANTGNFAAIPAGGAADAEARAILDTVQQLYTSTATTLGGQAGTFTGAAFLARDPQGTALTQFVLDAAINGREIFSRNNRTSGGNVEDVGRDETSFKNAVAEAQTRALLASLQATTFSDGTVAEMIRAISASDSAQRISEQIQAAVAYKAQKDAAAAAAAGTPTTSGNSDATPGLGAFVGVSVQQYDAGNQAIVDELKALRAEVTALKADNSAENTAATTLLRTMERILVRVSGGDGNPGDALSVRSLSTP